MKVQAIIFSKDRALQLQLALETFNRRCSDSEEVQIRVLYKASDIRHERQYRILRARFPRIHFAAETHFRSQLLRLAADAPWLLFMVDDVVFHRPFTLTECVTALETQPEALSVSLLLGANTIYCHTKNAPQPKPSFEGVKNSQLARFRWQGAPYDFGYPLEVSGSLFRTAHILALLHYIPFDTPNRLESALSTRTELVEQFPWRLVFPESVGFCNPLNRVQQVFANRIAAKALDAETLADYFDQGQTIDLGGFDGLTPNAAHFEASVRIRPLEKVPEQKSTLPRISAVIPAFNCATFMPEAVASLACQCYEHLEVIIVNNGSYDDTPAVARRLATTYPKLRIQVVDIENGDLADARNFGIGTATGDWVLPLNCDDRFAPSFLRQAADSILRKPEINLVFSDVQKFGAASNTWRPKDYSWQELLISNTFPYASLYRKELWELTDGYDPSLPWGEEDWNFWISSACFGLRPHRIADLLFEHRVHSQGSMDTKMMAHGKEVQACLHTMHPAAYPAKILVSDHHTIANMHAVTLARVEEIITRHPQLPMPYFWRGLTHEVAGRTAEALIDYTRATILSPHSQWQAYFRLYFINKNLSNTYKAKRCALNALNRRPEIVNFLKEDTSLNIKKILPLNLNN